MAIKKGKERRSNPTPYNKTPNKYPGVFAYVDELSVGKSSINDVDISYSASIVGKSNRIRKPHIGDEVLVAGKTGEGAYLFAAKIKEHVADNRTNLWKSQGGCKWNFNYSVEKLSQRVSLNWNQINNITQSDRESDKRIFQDRFQPQNEGTQITNVGVSRRKLVNWLKKNHKI